jgi:hypothetical protein
LKLNKSDDSFADAATSTANTEVARTAAAAKIPTIFFI